MGLLVLKSGTEIIFSLCTLVLFCQLQEQVRRKFPCFIPTNMMLTAVHDSCMLVHYSCYQVASFYTNADRTSF